MSVNKLLPFILPFCESDTDILTTGRMLHFARPLLEKKERVRNSKDRRVRRRARRKKIKKNR